MNLLTKFAAKLYPRWWRARYGDEFAALLEDARPGLRTTFDIAKSALWLRLSTCSFKRTVFIGALVGVFAAITIASFATPLVASTGNLILMVHDTPEDAPRVLGNAFQPLVSEALSRPNLAYIVRKLDLYPKERTRMSLDEVLDRMKRSISISMATRATNSTTLAIRFEYSERYKTLLAVEELTTFLQR